MLTNSSAKSITAAPATVWVQLSLATCLLFIAGSFFSISVFGVYIERVASPPGTLDDVWSSAMALMSLVSAPFMFTGGVFLSQGRQSSTYLPFGASKTDRIRLLSLVSCLCIPLLALGALGTTKNIPALITFAVAVQGIPFNLNFLLTLEMLAAWTPEHPGFAVGCGQMAFGLGSIFFSSFFKHLIDIFGGVNALYASSFLLTAISATITCFISWPPSGQSAQHIDEEGVLCATDDAVLCWKDLPFVPSFWLYLAVLLTAQQGFVFTPYLFKIGESFNKPMGSLVSLFQAMFFMAALCRPFVGVLADSFKRKSGFFSIASKNTAILMLAIQTLLFLALAFLSKAGNYELCMSAIVVIFVMFGAGECLAPILARDIFGPLNSSLAFGAGGSIGFGFGEYVTTTIMTYVVSLQKGTPITPSAFNVFYIFSFLWGVAGIAASVALSVYRMPTSRRVIMGGIADEESHLLTSHTVSTDLTLGKARR